MERTAAGTASSADEVEAIDGDTLETTLQPDSEGGDAAVEAVEA
jgi:hypothetical protein